MATSPANRQRIAALNRIRDTFPDRSGAAQRQRLLTAIQTLGHVSTLEAMRHLDVFDPRPRKLELVRDGHQVITTWQRVETEAGVTHRIGVYSMARG